MKFKKKYKERYQAMMQGGRAFVALTDCPICRAQRTNRMATVGGFMLVTIPHMPHHELCNKNNATKGTGSKWMVEVEKFAQSMFEANQLPLSKGKTTSLPSVHQYFTVKGAMLQCVRGSTIRSGDKVKDKDEEETF